MDFYQLGALVALEKLGADVPGDVWMQRMMQREGRSPQHIQGVLESHYNQGGRRTLPTSAGTQTMRGLPHEAARQKELGAIIEQARMNPPTPKPKASWLQRAGKALRFIK